MLELFKLIFYSKILSYVVMIRFHFVNNKEPGYPWIGVLRVKLVDARDGITGIVLIDRNLAITNALEIAKLDKKALRNTTRAVFLINNIEPYVCQVKDYILHPEYKHILNTVALVKLECNKNIVIPEHPINWPERDNEILKHVYNIGYTDRRRKLEKVIYRMKPINLTTCTDFYKKEKLDYKTITPTNYQCYLSTFNRKMCIYDSGMALATNNSGNWTLIGISILGPGCSLPSRFIPFYPYIPWIQQQMNPKGYRQGYRRKNVLKEDEWMYHEVEDFDTAFLERINHTTMVVRPTTVEGVTEATGMCNPLDGEMMYRENAYFYAPNKYGVGVYALSFYDIRFENYTCVVVSIYSEKRSLSHLWIDTGFHQDVIEPYIMTIPILGRNQTVPPAVLYLKNTYEKINKYQTWNIKFRFKFRDKATVKIGYYGKLYVAPTPEPDFSSTTHRTKWTYPTHWRPRGRKRRAKANRIASRIVVLHIICIGILFFSY